MWAKHKQQASGLPVGKVIYFDTDRSTKLERSLFDPDWQLTGKPDYLVEYDGSIVPVEVKSGSAPESPYDTHIYQLAAYCRLVEVTFHKRPSFGIIRYENQTFAIDYNPALEYKLKTMLADIRENSYQREINRSHESVERCRGCGYRIRCEQTLH